MREGTRERERQTHSQNHTSPRRSLSVLSWSHTDTHPHTHTLSLSLSLLSISQPSVSIAPSQLVYRLFSPLCIPLLAITIITVSFAPVAVRPCKRSTRPPLPVLCPQSFYDPGRDMSAGRRGAARERRPQPAAHRPKCGSYRCSAVRPERRDKSTPRCATE